MAHIPAHKAGVLSLVSGSKVFSQTELSPKKLPKPINFGATWWTLVSCKTFESQEVEDDVGAGIDNIGKKRGGQLIDHRSDSDLL